MPEFAVFAYFNLVFVNKTRIFKRKSIDTSLLIKISHTLNHNFFQYFTSSVIKISEKNDTLVSNISRVDFQKN